MKRLLRSKANFQILEGFLSELLGEDIFILEILESESNKESRRDKSNSVDLKVKSARVKSSTLIRESSLRAPHFSERRSEHPSSNISMGGRGRALVNIFVERLWRSVKHEDISMKVSFFASEFPCELKEYYILFNVERTHRSPDKVYREAIGGGAGIVDKNRTVNKQTEK